MGCQITSKHCLRQATRTWAPIRTINAMSSFHENLVFLLIGKGIYTTADQKRALARWTGKSTEAARRWLQGLNYPADDQLAVIARHLGKTEAELKYPGTSPPTVGEPRRLYAVKSDDDLRDDGDMVIDVADIELAAGSGVQSPEFVETLYKHTYRREWLDRKQIRDPSVLRRCKVRGDSMERVLFHGDMVTVNTADKRVYDGGTYAIVVADQIKVKYLHRRRDGGLDIVSENPAYPVETVPPDEIDTVHIIGRVIDKSGDGGL